MKTLGAAKKADHATILKQVKEAAQLNTDGVKIARPKRKPKPPLKVHAYFSSALKGNPKAFTTFQAFSPSHQREYVEWITAKPHAKNAWRRPSSG